MDVLTAIRHRRSIRNYSTRAVPDDVLQKMCAAIRWAPSTCNYQPWYFVFVTDPELRDQVAHASIDQLWIARAPVIVVGCGLPARAYHNPHDRGSSVDMDVAIAIDHLTLAATAEGLGTCWIHAFHEAAIMTALRIPSTVKIVAMTPLGYPASPDLIGPADDHLRKPPAEIFGLDYYGNPPPSL